MKFKDADLIGIPIQIVVGKAAAEGNVEIRDRATKTVEVVPAGEAMDNIRGRDRVGG